MVATKLKLVKKNVVFVVRSKTVFFFQEYKYVLICCEGSEIFKPIDNVFFLVLFKECKVIAQTY